MSGVCHPGTFSAGTYSATVGNLVSGSITASGTISNGTNSMTTGSLSSGAINTGTNNMTTTAITASGTISNGTNSMTTGSLSSGSINTGTNSLTTTAITASGMISNGTFSLMTGNISAQSADVLQDGVATSSFASGAGSSTLRTIGFSFTPTVDILVEDFGFIGSQLTSGGTRNMGIWRDSDQVLMVSGNVDTASPVVNGYFRTPCTATSLSSGIAYVIGIEMKSGNDVWDLTAQTMNTYITFGQSRFVLSTTLAFPSVVGSTNQAGVNFSFQPVLSFVTLQSSGITSTVSLNMGTNALTAGAASISSLSSSGTMSCGTNSMTTGNLTSGAINTGTNSLTTTAITASGTISNGTNSMTTGSLSSGAINTGTNNITTTAITASGTISNGTNSLSCGDITTQSWGSLADGVASVTAVSGSTGAPLTIGFAFTPVIQIQVVDLGFIPSRLSGGGTRNAAIWRNSDQVQMVASTIDTASPTVNGYLRTSCAATILEAGVLYVIGIQLVSGDIININSQSMNANITYSIGRQKNVSSLTFPDVNSAPTNQGGVNFSFNIPTTFASILSSGIISTVSLTTGTNSMTTGAVSVTALTSSGTMSCGTNSATTGNLSVSSLTSSGTLSAVGITSTGTITSGTNACTHGALSVTSMTSSGTVSSGTNAMTCGALSSTSVTSSGTLSAVGITSTGTITSGTNAATHGALSVTSMTSTGTVSSGTNSMTCGALSSTSVTSSGTLSAVGITSTGTVSAGTNAMTCGALSATSVTSSGTLSAVGITSTGTITSGTNALTSGALSSTSITTTGTLSCGTNSATMGALALSGVLSNSGQPCHIRTRSASQTIGNATDTTLTNWGTTEIDQGSITYASGVFTVPSTGVYLLFYFIDITQNSVGLRGSGFWINNTTTARRARTELAASAGPPSNPMYVNGADVSSLTANDTVRLKVYQDSGGNLDYNASTALDRIGVVRLY